MSKFLRISIALFFTAYIYVPNAVSAQKNGETSGTPRISICLNGIWNAARNDGKNQWREIKVPSSYADISFFRDQKIVWYKKEIYIPESLSSKTVLLSFDSVEYRSELYVNDKLVYKNPSGFIPFEVDISPQVQFGKINKISLKVENNRGYNDFPRSRWNNGFREPGIVQDVWLKFLPEVYTNHVAVTTSTRKMEIKTVTEIANRTKSAVDCTVVQYVAADKNLDLPVKEIASRRLRLNPGAEMKLNFSGKWGNPVFWGYEPYGKPFLYNLVTVIKKGNSIIDFAVEKFGFREFYSVGSQYYLNGRKIILTGDSIDMSQFPSRFALRTLFKAEREANINIIRYLLYTAPYPEIMNVADETGFMLRIGGGTFKDFFKNPQQVESAKRYWKAWIRKYGNHPSVVQWAVNNESCYQGMPFKAEERKLQAELSKYIKNADPSRLLIQAGDVQLMTAYKKGVTDYKPDVFSIHPYGKTFLSGAEEVKKTYDYDGSIPWDCDECYAGNSIVDDPLYSPSDYLKFNKQVTARYREVADYYEKSGLDVIKAGAAGWSPCTLFSVGYFGPDAGGEMQLGPWNIKEIMARRDNPEFRTKTRVSVDIPWPYMSGPGVKNGRLYPYKYAGVINWFDPAAAFFKKTLVHERVKKINSEIHQGDLPPVPDNFPPEILVKLPENKENNSIVLLERPGKYSIGSIADKEGNAYIVPPESGEYNLAVINRKQEYEIKNALKASDSRFPEKPGFSFLQCYQVDPEKQKVERTLLVEKAAVVHRPAPELIQRLKQKVTAVSRPSGIEDPVTVLTMGPPNSIYADFQPEIPLRKVISSKDKLLRIGVPGKSSVRKRSFFIEFDLVPDSIEGKQFLFHSWAKDKQGCYIQLDNGMIAAATHLSPKRCLSSFLPPLKPKERTHVMVNYFASGKKKGRYDGTVVIYINGVLAGINECRIPADWLTPSLDIGGNRFIHPKWGFNGVIDSVNIGNGFVDAKTVEERFQKKTRQVFAKKQIRNLSISKDGFIRDWIVLGPFPNPSKEGVYLGMQKDWLWEQGGEKNILPSAGEKVLVQFHDLDVWNLEQGDYNWRVINSKSDKIDLMPYMVREKWGLASKPGNLVAYAYCYLDIPEAGDYKIRIGSDDGHKLWVNGKFIGGDLQHGSALPDESTYDVKLDKGINGLLLKVDQSVGAHAFYCRLAADEKSLSKTKINLEK